MVLVSLLATASPRPASGAATIVVNSPVDEDANNDGCSLREAIIAANTNASHNGCTAIGAGVGDTIEFNLGTGTPIINIGSTPLPTITEAVTIDGGAGRVVQGRVELHGPGGPAVSQHHGLNVGTNGVGTVIRDLVINNFADDGIFIDADEVKVVGCFIGTDATGTAAVPNQGFGVQVGGGNGVRIGGATSGGDCTGDCNVISGALGTKANVLLDLDATGALVRGNFIGTDVTGTAKIANSAPGVMDKGSFDRIGGMNGTTPGGACTGDCNLISGNNGNGETAFVVDQAGILIEPSAVGTIIQGNFIGTDVTGNDAIGNGTSEEFSFGILSLSSTTGPTIGGTVPHARNVVSGNLGNGIQVSSPSTTVQGNYIGTNSAGTAAVPNSGTGVYVFQTSGATIGGTTPGAGNLMSGASASVAVGVVIGQSTTTLVAGNLIGTAADGTTPLPNTVAGIAIGEQSSNNTVGGLTAAAANTIAFNGIYGVVVVGSDDSPAHENAIRGNSIYGNGLKGIALLADSNDDIGYPVIDGTSPLHGTSCANCTVEIFSDSEDEGRVFEGSVFTADGNWTFNGPLNGPHVTATNTDTINNTSEFSAPFSLSTETPTPTATIPTPTSSATRTATRTSTSSETPTSPSTPSATSTATRTATATNSATATPTVNPSATGTASSSPTNTRTATPSATRTVTSTPSASPPPTVERTATSTVTGTATSLPSSAPSATPTDTPAASASATASATPVPCTGDCDGSGMVSINELIIGVNIALGTQPPSACPAFDNAGGTVDIAQLIKGVNNSLTDCVSAS
jgi:CSLREA domain-containing protein